MEVLWGLMIMSKLNLMKMNEDFRLEMPTEEELFFEQLLLIQKEARNIQAQVKAAFKRGQEHWDFIRPVSLTEASWKVILGDLLDQFSGHVFGCFTWKWHNHENVFPIHGVNDRLYEKYRITKK